MVTWAFRTRLISLFVLLVPLLVAASSVSAQDLNVVMEVAVTGNQNINTETIVGAITTKVGDEFKEENVDNDKAAIMSLGCFTAVTVRKETVPGGVKLTYEVTENPKVTDIKIEGSEPVPASKILEVMKTKPGQVLNTATLNQDIEAIQSYYGEERYIAYVTSDIGVDPASGVLTIPLLVHTVESVEIRGATKTKPYVFLREMKTKPGTVFNFGVLEKDIMKIFSLDILEDVQQYELTPGSEMGKVKVVIPVVEKKTGQVSVGIGYSSRQRLVGQARLSETNFRGTGQGLNVLWEQGTTDAVGGRASYEVGFHEPWLDKRHTSLSVTGYNKIVYRFSSGIFNTSTFGDDQTYNERHKGGEATLSRPLSETVRVYLGGRFENVDTNPALLSLTTSDMAQIVQRGSVGSGSARLVHDSRDLIQDPASGAYNVFSLEFGAVNADKFQLSSSGTSYDSIPFKGAFSKGTIELRRYFSKGGPRKKPDERRTALAVRVRIGMAGGTLPFFEQFFVGGAESLRGYREDRFWGTKMLLASVEFRKPIAQAISGVLFVDYGDAWDAPTGYYIGQLPQSSTFKGHFGVGVGMRVRTPIGNIRLDYGAGSEGGRTHFSIGQAF